jgi:uncharacterized protein (TIGR03083 family)
MDFEQHCAVIVDQTDLLRAALVGADLTTPVPSCPGWNVGQLARHLGGGQRWCAEIVGTRASSPPSDEHFRDLSPYADEDPAVVGPWLGEGAALVAEALRSAGPSAELWTPLSGVGGTTKFWARRFAHETVVHRADAELALGLEYSLDITVAEDTLDEWMELGALPEMFDFHPAWRDLLGEGRTVHLHATDVAAEWVVDLTGEAITWRRAHEKCAVAVRGPLVELVLMVFGRRAPGERVEVLGDSGLLDFWLRTVAFG